MKKRLKGLACFWMAIIMIAATLPMSALAGSADAKTFLVEEVDADNYSFEYLGGDETSYTFELGTALNEQDTIMDAVDAVTPDGYELDGWNLWTGFLGSAGVLSLDYFNGSSKLDADGFVSEDDYSDVSEYPGYYAIALEPFYKLKTFTVIWENYDGAELEKDEDVPYGTLPTYDSATPEKAADAEYTYTFDGWTPDIEEVTGDVTYTATYITNANTYTVIWENYDGAELEKDEDVPYGTLPTYDSATPEKAADAEYTYTFDGWTPDVEEVTGDVTYTATYTTNANTYTVIWENHDGTELEKDEDVPYGTLPIYDGVAPEKASDAEYTYTFDGWTPDIEEVTGDVTYTAIYTTNTNTYTVIWENYDGAELEKDEDVPYGTLPTYDGVAPEKASDAEYTYTFDGWTPDVEEVTGDVTYTATYTTNANTYTVIWENYDGTELEKDEDVPYGTLPTYDGVAPEKASDAEYTYTFDGWTPDVEEVTGDITYSAKYTQTPIYTVYTVTFDTNGGSTVDDAEVEGGNTVSKPSNPTKNKYRFSGWYTDTELDNKYDFDTPVTESFTLYAKWTRKISGGGGGMVSETRYTVKFETNSESIVNDKSVVKNTPVAKPYEPKKEGYTFDGWYTDKELTLAYDFEEKVTKDFTLYAKWTEKEPEKDTDSKEDAASTEHNCYSKLFDDLDITKWYHLDTDYVIEKDIFKGVTKSEFDPNGKITRAMMITVLYRADGEPEVTGKVSFKDVDENSYYTNAVIWGQQNEIIKGYSETEFGPNDNITREQIATIMHRYAKLKGIDVSVGENTNILSYEDFDDVSEYAIPSMQWAVGSGLIKGRTEKTLNPKDTATRVEIAAILHRFMEANK